jgi:hypothetical protein
MTTPINNGSILDKYSWTQTAYDLTVMVPLNFVQIKDICIEITNRQILIFVKGENVLPYSELTFDIKVDRSYWYKDENTLIIELEKYKKHEWWKSVFVGEKEIDTSKVVPPTESIGDLDSETISTIDKMIYDQKKKADSGFYKE